MVRLILFLIIIAISAILVLSNLSPISLTILGIRTLALPLGVWVVGAIGAGAFTTVILSLLVGSTRPVASRPRRSTPRGAADRPWNAWTNQQNPQPAGKPSGSASTSSRLEDDWEGRKPPDEWDDWSDYKDPSVSQAFNPPPGEPSFQTRTRIRDREDETWANWEGYDDDPDEPENFGGSRRSEARRNVRENVRSQPFNEEVDDLDDDFVDRPSRSTPPAQRTDFESPQEPATRYQAGSVYSYGYRRSADRPDEPPTDSPTDRLAEDDEDIVDDDIADRPEPPQPTARAGEVYDAEYRVIVPPYRPDAEAGIEPSPPPPDLEEEPETPGEEFGVRTEYSRTEFSIEDFYNADEDDDDDDDEKEIWDEDWGLDDPPKDDRPK